MGEQIIEDDVGWAREQAMQNCALRNADIVAITTKALRTGYSERHSWCTQNISQSSITTEYLEQIAYRTHQSKSSSRGYRAIRLLSSRNVLLCSSLARPDEPGSLLMVDTCLSMPAPSVNIHGLLTKILHMEMRHGLNRVASMAHVWAFLVLPCMILPCNIQVVADGLGQRMHHYRLFRTYEQ